MNIFQNVLAQQSFFCIINAYGAFVNLKSLVKKIEPSPSKEKAISELISNKIDHYSDSDYGISRDTINEISNHVENIENEINESLIQSLIEAQKYYKKLKHQFKNNFSSQINSEMEFLLEQHIEFLATKKMQEIKEKDLIDSYKEEIISFLNYSFGAACRSHKIAANQFFCSILRKYNISYDKQHIDSILNVLEDEKKYQVTKKDIGVIKELISNFINHVTESDINNPDLFLTNNDNKLNPKKVEIAKGIVIKSIHKYKSLLSKLANINI